MNWITGLLLAGLLAGAGCGKSDKNSAQAKAGAIDLAKFSEAFPSPTTEQQRTLASVREGVRYRLYPKAVEALTTLASDPTLTEPQKKAVNDLLQGVKAAIANTPAAPAQ